MTASEIAAALRRVGAMQDLARGIHFLADRALANGALGLASAYQRDSAEIYGAARDLLTRCERDAEELKQRIIEKLSPQQGVS